MIRSAIRHLERLHDGLRQTEQIYMVLVATLIGLLGGSARWALTPDRRGPTVTTE